ncbi:hypothetical protein NUM3379_23440 [Kineococcus sp. NUM-3379]
MQNSRGGAGPGADGEPDERTQEQPVRDGQEGPDDAWDDDSWDPQGHDDGWEEQQELQRRARLRRVRRQRAVFALVVLAVFALGAAAALVATGRWSPFGEQAQARPTCTTPAAPAPAAPADVRVEVLNSTDRRGLAATVAEELRGRGFTVTRVGNSDGGPVPEPAAVRHAPAAAPAARAVAARLGGAVLVEDPAAVDVVLVLGEGYQQLAPEDALAPLPPPPAPACAAPRPAA